MAETSYLIGLGSNRYRGGPPRRIVAAAIDTLVAHDLSIIASSSIVETPPLGPGHRNYANAAILVETRLAPGELLALCKTVEAQFGRRGGKRWGDRSLDLDLLLWSGGCWAGPALTLPHPALAKRKFVLGPLAEIAPDWRHPITGLTIRQHYHHVQRNMPVDRSPNHP
ncbi:2-amino-4-hydroxy-6-hydroxymethyldihydropteridine diphosphokinase [Parasphingopyxis lamellibrachiae]|uniref:2-amino-4-hydroxy-6-hydroxymethyldihydropteridine pyrophosphokinase n=1 Tax=Parasphingopyxis lamellibrachiae TaxID=680125 RepID=A0A3D9FC31_9SPHN|nr:2-amino-4-hydroxy-6-hydroxymethyldihydropteridine diphosphokinase [Parasphingopyxis lamellibrachiae]RED15283.1 2-amino-4-hydroxy-6-hydroxymethyldihydropteridine diphosphokinase [Parasphingopyxis lamellibrachiae]